MSESGAHGLYEKLPSDKKDLKCPKNVKNDVALPLDLAALLPLPKGRNVPDSEFLEDKLRHRALQLCRDSSSTKKEAIAKKRKSAGKLVIPKEEQKYALYEPLAQLWRDYVNNAVGDGSRQNISERIVRMDLHGAVVQVVRSKDPGLVGVRGILIAETANTILVVTKADRVITVPKSVAVIRFVVGKKLVELVLPALMFRASERSVRKLKKTKKDLSI